MNRNFTNIIRYLMDEWLPAAIRDNKFFMYPFFWLAYKGKDIDSVMDFKKNVYLFSDDEYKNFYDNLENISRSRVTDLNKQCIDHIVNAIGPDDNSFLDVGCGHGFLLNCLKQANPHLQLSGMDLVDKVDTRCFDYQNGDICKMPYGDKTFDVLSCCHTLEHIVDLHQACKELMRVTAKRLYIVVPCQRYYYYTLDEHVSFFTHEYQLSSLFPDNRTDCVKLNGDWMFTVYADE